jgi:hypothetical protein
MSAFCGWIMRTYFKASLTHCWGVRASTTLSNKMSEVIQTAVGSKLFPAFVSFFESLQNFILMWKLLDGLCLVLFLLKPTDMRGLISTAVGEA